MVKNRTKWSTVESSSRVESNRSFPIFNIVRFFENIVIYDVGNVFQWVSTLQVQSREIIMKTHAYHCFFFFLSFCQSGRFSLFRYFFRQYDIKWHISLSNLVQTNFGNFLMSSPKHFTQFLFFYIFFYFFAIDGGNYCTKTWVSCEIMIGHRPEEVILEIFYEK